MDSSEPISSKNIVDGADMTLTAGVFPDITFKGF